MGQFKDYVEGWYDWDDNARELTKNTVHIIEATFPYDISTKFVLSFLMNNIFNDIKVALMCVHRREDEDVSPDGEETEYRYVVIDIYTAENLSREQIQTYDNADFIDSLLGGEAHTIINVEA